jgi:hypothetical protein
MESLDLIERLELRDKFLEILNQVDAFFVFEFGLIL